MIELTVANVIRVLALAGMLFCLGLSTEVSEEARKTAKTLWGVFIVILWIFIIAS